MRTMKTLLAATVLGTSALLLTACGGDDTAKEAAKPEDVAIQFTKSIFEGDGEKMMSLLDTRGLKDEEKEAATGKMNVIVESTKNAAEVYGGYKSTEVTEVTGECKKEGEVCNIKLKHVFGNGKEEVGNVKIINIGGEYKIALK